ncbi:MAG: hypothetical protein HFH67_15990 [Lachnospiraceae bacterium]|nr:hypothetical protein [Lachnospiraceae bacterium]
MHKLKYIIIILAAILFSGITAIVPRTANARSQAGFLLAAMPKGLIH